MSFVNLTVASFNPKPNRLSAPYLLRFPKSLYGLERRAILTAAPSSPRFISHRERFGDDATGCKQDSTVMMYWKSKLAKSWFWTGQSKTKIIFHYGGFLSPPSLRRRPPREVFPEAKGRFVYFGARMCQSKSHSGLSVENLKVFLCGGKRILWLYCCIFSGNRFSDDAVWKLKSIYLRIGYSLFCFK